MSIDPSIYEDQQRSSGGWVKWGEIGETHKLVIVSAKKRQATEFGTGKPQHWDDGSPKEELVLTGTDPDTAETVNMVIKWWGLMKRAFVVGLDGRELEVGGTFAMQWTGLEESSRPGLNPAKTWKAAYAPPKKAAIDVGDLL